MQVKLGKLEQLGENLSQAAQKAAIAQYYTSLAAMNRGGWLEVLATDAVIYDPVGKPHLKVKEDSPKFFNLSL